MTDYFSRPGLSGSQVATYLADPIKWYHQYIAKDWPFDPPTPAMQFGTMVHSMLETGGPVPLCVAVKPDGLDLRTKEGKAWLAGAKEEERTIIDSDQWQSLNRIWEHVRSNGWLFASLLSGTPEMEFYWDDDDLGECKGKIDLLTDAGAIIDWKTTSCRTEHAFINEIVSRSYDVRMALYRRAVREMTHNDFPPVYLVSIQTTGGNSVQAFRLSEDWLEDAEARLIVAVDEMREFNLAAHLNRPPKTISQPRYSVLNLETV